MDNTLGEDPTCILFLFLLFFVFILSVFLLFLYYTFLNKTHIAIVLRILCHGLLDCRACAIFLASVMLHHTTLYGVLILLVTVLYGFYIVLYDYILYMIYNYCFIWFLCICSLFLILCFIWFLYDYGVPIV